MAHVKSRFGEFDIKVSTAGRTEPPQGVVFAPFFAEETLVNLAVQDTYCPLSKEPDYKKTCVSITKVGRVIAMQKKHLVASAASWPCGPRRVLHRRLLGARPPRKTSTRTSPKGRRRSCPSPTKGASRRLGASGCYGCHGANDQREPHADRFRGAA